ncbi:metalloproteinase inhibitor 2b [Trichomycterus rosablanca]|uniref:metalloproteinase inhibitor 2b n=1 Tax=Trichomycterus rosablanca TaxID=2290929 RepID=UPI002F35A6CE
MTKPSSLCAPFLLFVVWRAAKLAEACSCSPVHPQQAHCNADVVFRARVVGQQEVVTGNDVYGNPIKRIRYDVKQIKMFKGPDREIDAIFTGPSSAVCGVNLNSNDKKEYLITGKLESDGTLHVTLCDFIDSWESLTPAQRKGFESRYDMGCMCRVARCPSVPCSVSDPVECLWTDWIMETTRQGPQARHYTCIKRNDDSCAWYRGATNPKKEFLDIEDP